MEEETKDVTHISKACNCPSCCELLEELDASIYLCSQCKVCFLIIELSIQEGMKLCRTLDYYLRGKPS